MKIDYHKHAHELAEAIHASIYECHVCPPHRAMADRLTRECHVPPVVDDIAYALALHELGHLANDPIPPTPPGLEATSFGGLILEIDRFFRLLMESKAPAHIIATEEAAWQWAQDHALEWSPDMEHVRRIGMSSYLDRYATYLYRGGR